MDTTVWGPLFWSLAFDVAKFCDPSEIQVDAYFSSWQDVLPCIHCRRSYREFYRKDPPPTGKRARGSTLDARRQELHAWLHSLKSKVNAKLNRQMGLELGAHNLSLAKSVLRREIWSYSCGEGWFWDHWYILACNYPQDASNPKSDVEREKIPGYAIYAVALVGLCKHLPYAARAHESLSKTVWSHALSSRTNLLRALREAAVRAEFEKRSVEEIERIYSKCDPSRN